MTAATQATAKPVVVERQNPVLEVWSNLRRSKSGMIGLALIVFSVLIALLSPYIVPYDPLEMNAKIALQPPSMEHLMGTDKLGRDMLSRSMVGGRVTLLVTIVATFIAVGWGSLVGILSGFLGGKSDEASMRLVDAFLSIPWLLIMMLIVSIFGTDIWVLILAFGFAYGVSTIRIARAATLDHVTDDYILAARARGQRKRTIVSKELFPNVLDVVMVDGAMNWSWMLLGFASLSFLGLGVPPPTPDWGTMIAQNREILAIQPWAVFGPALMLSIVIVGINLFSDAFAKALGLDRSQGAPV